MNETLQSERLGIALDETSVAELICADDICLLEDNRPDAQRLLTKITEKAALIGFQINISKTKFCSRDPTQTFQIDGEDIEMMENFNYFGSKIQPDGNISPEIKSRIGKAAGSFKNMKNVWNAKKIPQTTKINLNMACVRSVLLYG